MKDDGLLLVISHGTESEDGGLRISGDFLETMLFCRSVGVSKDSTATELAREPPMTIQLVVASQWL